MFRYCFFENIASVAAFVGWHCSTILKPLLQQGRAMMLKLRKPWWIFLYPFLLFFFMLENKKNVRLNVIMCYLSASFYAGLLNLNPYSFQYLDQNNENICILFKYVQCWSHLSCLFLSTNGRYYFLFLTYFTVPIYTIPVIIIIVAFYPAILFVYYFLHSISV